MFGSLLEHPLVAADALDRYPQLVSMFDKELDCCKLLYSKHIQAAEELGETTTTASYSILVQFNHLTERRRSEQSLCMDPTRV